jgi:hypothetical protein
MAEATFVGNWNLFRGNITDEGKVSVANSTCRIDDGDEGYVKVKLAEWPEWQAVLRLSDASGYVEGTGSSANWFTRNFLFFVLSEDGKTFHGAVKRNENDPPLPWWGVRQ